MADEHQLEELFTGAVHSITRHFIITDGKVTATNPDAWTCSVQVGGDQGATFYNVPLRVLKGVGNQSSLIEWPVIGTDCQLTFMDGNNNRPIMYRCHQFQDLEINAQGNVIYNGGNLGGMVNARELKTQSEKDQAILQAVLDILTGPPINEPGNGAPSALQQVLAAALVGKSPGTWDDLENSKIQQ